jgi:hypothetical protein
MYQDHFSVACTRVNGSGRLRRHIAGERRKMIDAAVPSTLRFQKEDEHEQEDDFFGVTGSRRHDGTLCRGAAELDHLSCQGSEPAADAAGQA